MSDRVAAAEAILATLTTARARMTALASAHLPFDRALALELRATVGSSPERVQLEWVAAMLDHSRVLSRIGVPLSRVAGDPGGFASAATPSLPVISVPSDEQTGDEDTYEAASAAAPVSARLAAQPTLIVIEPEADVVQDNFDAEPDLAPALGVESDASDESADDEAPILPEEEPTPPALTLAEIAVHDVAAPPPQVQILDEDDEPEEPVEQEPTQQESLVATTPVVSLMPEPELEPEPATEESLTEEAPEEEPAPINFDYLVRFVEPARTPPPTASTGPVPIPEEELSPTTEPEGGGLVMLSDDDISAPEEDELLDEAMEKALDGDEPSVVGGQLVFDYAPPVVNSPGVEDGGTEGVDDEPEQLVDLSPATAAVAPPRPRVVYDEERTLPAPPPVRGEPAAPSEPPPRRDPAPGRGAAIAFTPVSRPAGRGAPEFNPPVEVAAEESDDLLSPEPEDHPVARGGGGFAVTLERPGGPALEEEYDEPSDEAPPVNAPRLTDDTEDYSSGFDGGAAPQPEVDAALAADFLRQAREAEGNGNLSKAIMFYQDLLDLTPENMEGYLGRGRCFMEMGDYAAAMSDFQRAEDLDTRSPEPLVEMGNLFFARKEYRRAIEFYDQAIELDPTHAMARCRRGICHHYRKNHKQAFQDLQRAYSLNPEIPNIRKYVQMAVKAMEKPR